MIFYYMNLNNLDIYIFFILKWSESIYNYNNKKMSKVENSQGGNSIRLLMESGQTKTSINIVK